MNFSSNTKKFFPFFNWLPLVNKKSIWQDFSAGITGAIIVLPQAVAFSMIAGLPVIYGLYTAMVTPIIAALFGSSYHLISGPTTAISLVVFSAVSQFAEPFSPEFISIALTLTFVAGIFQFFLGLARMGSLINFVSHSVVIGFTAGAAMLIITSQIPGFLGLSIEKGNSFLHNWLAIFLNLYTINPYVLGIALTSLLSAIFFKKVLPKWPYLLLAMVAGAILNILLDGQAHGVKMVGELPAKLPSFNLPDLSLESIKKLAPNAFAIALLGLIEAVAIARSIAAKTQQRIDGNQEFIGQGLSNIGGSLFSCYAGSGSFTRSGINHQAGAATPLSAIFAALILMVIILLVAPWAAYLPMPAMAGIILLVGWNLIDFHHIKVIAKASKQEKYVLLVTFLSTLFLELEFAIYIGVLLSLFFYLNQTSRPRVVVLAPDRATEKGVLTNVNRKPLTQCPQLLIVRIDGSLFFGAVDHVAGKLSELNEAGVKHLLIIASGINFIDVAGAEFLVQESARWRANGGGFYICGIKKTGRELLAKGGYNEDIGLDYIFSTKRIAISYIFKQLDQNICNQCTARIFDECQTIDYKIKSK